MISPFLNLPLEKNSTLLHLNSTGKSDFFLQSTIYYALHSIDSISIQNESKITLENCTIGKRVTSLVLENCQKIVNVRLSTYTIDPSRICLLSLTNLEIDSCSNIKEEAINSLIKSSPHLSHLTLMRMDHIHLPDITIKEEMQRICFADSDEWDDASIENFIERNPLIESVILKNLRLFECTTIFLYKKVKKFSVICCPCVIVQSIENMRINYENEIEIEYIPSTHKRKREHE